MKCPICETMINEENNFCPYCGWDLMDDLTVHPTLFDEEQIRRYEERIQIHKRLVNLSRSGVLQGQDRNAIRGNRRNLGYSLQLTDGELHDLMESGEYSIWEIEDKLNEATDHLAEAVCRRIIDGSFEKLYVGDYFDGMEWSSDPIRLIVAGFDCLSGRVLDQNGNEVDHYAVLVAQNRFFHQISPPSPSNAHRYYKALKEEFGEYILHCEGEQEFQKITIMRMDGDRYPEHAFPLYRLFPEELMGMFFFCVGGRKDTNRTE